MLPRQSTSQALAVSLRAGAAYDALFAFLLVGLPTQIGALFRLPLPAERFYLWLIAFFLSALAGFYLLVARDPWRYPEFVRLVISIRLLGAVVIAGAAIGRPDLAGLFAIAFADLAFGLAHLRFSRQQVP